MQQIFYAIVVIYNERLDQGKVETVSILNRNDCTIIICDNSTIDEVKRLNKEFAFKNRLRYIDMEGNHGLSIAYNTGISEIIKNTADLCGKWLMIFDQDTHIPVNFFDLLLNELEKNRFVPCIYVPLVFDNKFELLSPCRFSGVRFKRCKCIDIDDNSFFINSGMCIPLSFFENCKYDEEIFLDFVDYDFIKTMRKLYGNCFKVMTSISLQQEFSGTIRSSKTKELIRYIIYCNDAIVFYKKWNVFYCFSMTLVFLRSIKLSLIHKDIIFIWKFFSNVVLRYRGTKKAVS